MKHKNSNFHAHLLVAKTAKEIAGAFYEGMAKGSDHFYKENPDQETWIKKAWPLFVDEARATLAALLTTHTNEELKETIRDALIKDASLIRGRVGQVQVKNY